MMVNWKKMRKEAAVIQFKVIFCHLPGETYKNHENSCQDSLALADIQTKFLIFERTMTSDIQVCTIGLSPFLLVSLPGTYDISHVDFPNRMQAAT